MQTGGLRYGRLEVCVTWLPNVNSQLLRIVLVAAICVLRSTGLAQQTLPPTRGDLILSNYFRVETQSLAAKCLTDVTSLAEWKARREILRQQLFEMLGLSPLPQKGQLKATVTGTVESESITVEKLHFQSLPGLYVTANLYRPKQVTKPLPTILYVCGHGAAITNGVSYGNKVSYQHHGVWFARHGYVCLIIDSLELSEIQGIHHGTYREGMWWWNSRGYTPAGVEAWNSIRAIDYLITRPDVDRERIGITGRSGGGAYSWTTTALDDRIKVAAPVAGITDLRNHVVNGAVEGHCDCMFFVNTYRWDYPMMAALVAPRPLLLGNSDKDSIFPLDGVERLDAKVRQIYKLYGTEKNYRLLITEGPHKDTQDLQVPVFRWFNRQLKGEDPIIDDAATRLFTGQQLKVLDTLPADSINAKIHETFVPAAPTLPAPENAKEWEKFREHVMTDLKTKGFAGWPQSPPPLNVRQIRSLKQNGIRLRTYEFQSQAEVPLRFYVIEDAKAPTAPDAVITILDEGKWASLSAQFKDKTSLALDEDAPTSKLSADTRTSLLPPIVENGKSTPKIFFAPRGIGATAWTDSAKNKVHVPRRFMLLGQTVDSMRVWDIRRALQAIHESNPLPKRQFMLNASGTMAVNCLYASLHENNAKTLRLDALPNSHRNGPDYLNVMRFLDIPTTVTIASEGKSISVSHE